MINNQNDELMETKSLIIDRLLATKRDNIARVVEYMEQNGFFSAHCHHHHHYEGGLADHVWQTYLFAKQHNDSQIDDDSVAVCALLHDFCDCHGMRDIKGHGHRSAKMLKELGFVLSDEEYLAIRFHMGLRKHTEHPRYDDAVNSKLCSIIHLADKMSARQIVGSDI